MQCCYGMCHGRASYVMLGQGLQLVYICQSHLLKAWQAIQAQIVMVCR